MVGRASTKANDKLYSDVAAKYAFRHRVNPGVTGWAQVNGWRGETKTVEQMKPGRLRPGVHLWFDLRIMVLTIGREILSRHAF